MLPCCLLPGLWVLYTAALFVTRKCGSGCVCKEASGPFVMAVRGLIES